MKKIIVFFLCMLCLENVKALEQKNITNEVEIKYKWYQEEITEGFYYPKKEKLNEYFEDIENIQYSEYSDWNEEYCVFSKDNYLIEEKIVNTYEKVDKTKYLEIDFIRVNGEYCNDCVKEIKIFSERKEINYKIILQNDRQIKIELPEEFDTEKLWFFIDTDNIYNMYLLKDINLPNINLSQYIKKSKILIPDKGWITSKTTFVKEINEQNLDNNEFVKNIEKTKICRVREKNTYRYKINKKYYDDNYYSYLENYIPDIKNYTAYYIKEFPTDIIEITKTDTNYIKEKEYIYIEPKEEPIENENIKDKEKNTIVHEIKYIDKIVKYIPIKIYILLLILFIVIIILTLKLLKKKVD